MEKPNIQDINKLVNDEEIKEVETTEEVIEETPAEVEEVEEPIEYLEEKFGIQEEMLDEHK